MHKLIARAASASAALATVLGMSLAPPASAIVGGGVVTDQKPWIVL